MSADAGLQQKVAPLMGAWIEIQYFRDRPALSVVAPLMGAWIEIEEAKPIEATMSGRAPHGRVD